MAAIRLQSLSIQEALEIFSEGSSNTQKKIDTLAKEILESLKTPIFGSGPFLTLVSLALSAEEVIKNTTGTDLGLEDISLEKGSIKQLLEKSGTFISFNGHPYKL